MPLSSVSFQTSHDSYFSSHSRFDGDALSRRQLSSSRMPGSVVNVQSDKVSNMVREQCLESLHMISIASVENHRRHKTYIAVHVES